MNENNIAVSISCDNLSLYANDTTRLVIDIINDSSEILDSVFFKLIINSENIEIISNDYNISKNTFLNIGTLNPYESKQFDLKLKVNKVFFNITASIQSVLNYMIKNEESYTHQSINSNILDISLKANNDSSKIDSLVNKFMDNTCLTRSIGEVLEESPAEFVPQNTLEPYIVGSDNTSYIVKDCDNNNPQIGDIITFNCCIKNIGNLPCRNLIYEEDANPYFEFIDSSLYINDTCYSDDIFYGVKITNFKPGDELNISYQFKVIDIPRSKIIDSDSIIKYSYISNQNIEHRSIKVKSSNVKVGLSSYDINLNHNSNTRSAATFQDVLNIAKYSLNIVDTNDLGYIKLHSIYNCSFRIVNDGNMKCNSINLKINLPDYITYVENSLYSNGNCLNITSLDDSIYLENLDKSQFIDIIFKFKPNQVSESTEDSINIEIDSLFMSYSSKEIVRNYSIDLTTLEFENTTLKEFSIDSNYKINSDESTFYKILNIESDVFIDGYRQIVPKKYNSTLTRNESRNFILKGYVTNKIQYISLDSSINTINRKTPFSVNLTLDKSIDPSDLIAICNNVNYRLLNKRLVLVSNNLSIQ